MIPFKEYFLLQEENNNYNSIDEFREYWNSQGVKNMTDIYSGTSYKYIRPVQIEVAKDKRKQGLGTAFMEDLIRFADERGLQIRLNPSDKMGATSLGRLERFYKRFGLVKNAGRNKDFSISERFYRDPKKTIK